MRKSIFGVMAMSVMVVAVAGAAVGQNPRAGAGTGAGRANGYGPGSRATVAQAPNASQAPGYGQGFRGAGGWWNRVTPQTPEQTAFVAQVSELHNRIRAANGELRALAARNAPAVQVQAKQQEVASLQSQLRQLTTANQALLQQMGVPAGYGVCDGTGPRGGQGYGRRGGMGRGMAQGPRDGSGPGRGMRLGPRDGSGPNANCPLKTP